jgi:glutathione S-transferase
MLIFYGAPNSSAGKCHWMLEEVGAPYEYRRVNLRDAEDRAAFLAVSPMSRVPLLVDGDYKLAESAAINFYLAERYAPALMPSTLEARALVYQWCFWGLTNLQPEAMDVMLHTFLLPESARNAEIAVRATRNAEGLVAELEAALTHDFLLGDALSVADVTLGATVNLALRARAATGGPRVTRWIESLRARPAYQRAVAAA